MSSASLNVDVLALVCEFLTDVPDILAFSLTSSALRQVANTWLLSRQPVYLADGVSVRRFHSFLFADLPARAPYVHALEIINSPSNVPLRTRLPGDASLLHDILISCPRLEHVSVFLQEGSGLCTDDPSIINAIAGIHTLRSLSILGWGLSAFELLRQVRAPLRELNLSFSDEQTTFWSPVALGMFLPRHLPPTLERLGLCDFFIDVDDAQLQAHPSIQSSLQPYKNLATYPLVRSLHSLYVVQRPLLEHLQRFFPALDGTLSIGILDANISEETYSDLRALNQLAQEGGAVSGSTSSSSRPGWKKLDRLICDPQMFYVLGLRCPIRLVMLDCCSPLPLARSCIADALRENPVPRLKLSFALTEGRDMLDGLFAPEVARVLTRLTLVVEFSNDGAGMADPDIVEHLRWEDLLNSIIMGLQPLHKLTHLRLVVHSNIHHDPASPVAYSREFVRETRGSVFDFAGVAARLARSLPSLRYVFVTTSGYLANRNPVPAVETRGYKFWITYDRWHDTRAWRVDPPASGAGFVREGGPGPVLVELRKEVAERIMQNEELVLSEVDEGTLHFDED